MPQNNDEVNTELKAEETMLPEDRSLLVSAGWGRLGVYAAFAVIGITVFNTAFLAITDNPFGELLFLMLLFVVLVVFGQPSQTKRTRGIVYWLLTGVLAVAIVTILNGANQIFAVILSTGVVIDPEFVQFTGIFVSIANSLGTVLVLLFFLWWSGSFRPKRLLKQKGWLKLIAFILIGAFLFGIFGRVVTFFPDMPYIFKQAIICFLGYTSNFFCWALILGSKCLCLEDGVGFIYIRPKQLGITTGVIAVLAAGIGTFTVVMVLLLRATAWVDNLLLFADLADWAMEAAYGSTAERADYL